MAYGVIYCLTDNTNGKKYVGQTNNLKRRIKEHKNEELYVDRAIRTHGWENFSVEVLEECDNRAQINEREQFWINKLNTKSPNGYNLTDGGFGLTGCTEDVRKVISDTSKGRKCSEATKALLSAIFTGRKFTEESKAKMYVAAKKRAARKTPEQKAAEIAKANKSRSEKMALKSPEERSKLTEKARIASANRTPEERSLGAKKSWESRTPEERTLAAIKREAKKTPEQRSRSSRKIWVDKSPVERTVIANKGWNTRKAKKFYRRQIVDILNQIISKKI